MLLCCAVCLPAVAPLELIICINESSSLIYHRLIHSASVWLELHCPLSVAWDVCVCARVCVCVCARVCVCCVCVCVCVCVWFLWTILLCIALMQCWFPYDSAFSIHIQNKFKCKIYIRSCTLLCIQSPCTTGFIYFERVIFIRPRRDEGLFDSWLNHISHISSAVRSAGGYITLHLRGNWPILASQELLNIRNHKTSDSSSRWGASVYSIWVASGRLGC